MKAKILLVEDDINLGDVLTDYLELQGYEVVKALDGVEGIVAFRMHSFDLLILDVMMPRKDGFTLASEIRALNQQIPIIFLTARGQEEDRVKGFKTGGDDYITKPFNSEELELRISAIIKRCQPAEQNRKTKEKKPRPAVSIGKYLFDPFNHELRIGDRRLPLTPKEVDLLLILNDNKNQLVTREKVLLSVWGTDDYFNGRSMDVFITKLRKYLKDDPDIAIVNVHGTGFRLEVKE